uniref:Sushi domain-containing protein n=1 Tax=Mastacembelus armatus TaxID=205130 RepID=A0A7N8XEC2_9TELE
MCMVLSSDPPPPKGYISSLRGFSFSEKTCGSAGEVTNGNIEYVPDNEFGGKAVVKCNTGFISVGGIEMNCEDQGWTGRLPVCEVQTCLPPSQIENGGYQPEREIYRYLENIVYSCRTPDYTLVGENSRTCSSDGTFKPDPPTCAKSKCLLFFSFFFYTFLNVD